MGRHPQLWELIADLHIGCTEYVNWYGHTSREYKVGQGVRQGGIISTDLYKVYIKRLLETMPELNLGNIQIASPTCADDVLLISLCPYELHAMLDSCVLYASDNR